MCWYIESRGGELGDYIRGAPEVQRFESCFLLVQLLWEISSKLRSERKEVKR